MNKWNKNSNQKRIKLDQEVLNCIMTIIEYNKKDNKTSNNCREINWSN